MDLRRRSQESPTKDDVLDNITLYWLTNTATSSARLYWENGARGSVIVAAAQKTAEISLPVAITVFPEDVYRPPETWARRAYRNLTYFHEVDKGGHSPPGSSPNCSRGAPCSIQITADGTLTPPRAELADAHRRERKTTSRQRRRCATQTIWRPPDEQYGNEPSEQRNNSQTAPTADLKLEVIALPVSDVDRAKRFYGNMAVATGRRFLRR